MRVIIAGGRHFEDYKLLKFKCNEILKNVIEEILIVSGGAKGADTLAIKYAKEKGYKFKVYEADWDNISIPGAVASQRKGSDEFYNVYAGKERNIKMAKNADCLIAFWDGKSRGTEHMIDVARQKNLKVRIIKYA